MSQTPSTPSKTASRCADSPSRHVPAITGRLTLRNRWEHFRARCGLRRGQLRAHPGLYALGSPTPRSPVLVTANYSLSFDALRSAMAEADCYILVLDTKGINVWCAAGKGTFGTDELVRRIEMTGLHEVVKHRTLILPQLGAPGVAAHEVKRRSGFRVKYGPVRAVDLGAFLEAGEATPQMRRVCFGPLDRLVLAPIELVHHFLPTLAAALVAYWLGGAIAAAGVFAAVLAGLVLFPLLLPWLPTPNFSTKGFFLGGLVAAPFAVATLLGNAEATLWWRAGWASTWLLVLPPVTAFLALNFTGSTTFTSRSGVEREIFAYLPLMAWSLGGGLALAVAFAAARTLGVSP